MNKLRKRPKRTFRLPGEDQDELIVKLRHGKALPKRNPEENKKLLDRIIKLVEDTGDLFQTETESHDILALLEDAD